MGEPNLLQKGKEKGIHDYFMFDVEPWIEAHPDFDARHYSPLASIDTKKFKRGTIAYDDFWDEQDDRCVNGYAPVIDGVQYPRITGPHYFYLNMYMIMMIKIGSKVKKLGSPYYRTLDHMLFLEIEQAGKRGYGIIVGKARRMGLSYIGSLLVLWHLLFFKDASVAVGAGKEDKALALFDKVMKGLQNIREEYAVSYKKTKDSLKLVYQVTDKNVRKDKGVGSTLDVKTFFSDPSAFEGGSYAFFIFEEIGLHENLIKSYKASEPCFMDGQMQFGVPFLFGTGAEVDKGSRDFKIIWGDPRAYNMKKIFIPAYMYYPGSDDDEDDVNFFDPRTGMTDKKRALEHILERRERAKKSKEGFIKEVQSRPTEEAHLFIKTHGGILDRVKLATQRERVFNKENDYQELRGRYEWIDTPEVEMLLRRAKDTKEKAKIRIRHNVKVRFVEDPDGTVMKLKGVDPINNDDFPYKVDIGASDSYDDEGEIVNGSKGATVAYRVFSGLSRDYDMLVGYVYERGDGTDDDTFFENSLMHAVFWNMEVLIEYTKFAILRHFKDVGAYKYLRENPNISKDIVVNNGKQEYGVKMTSGTKGFKSLVTKLLKMEVKDNSEKMNFDEVLTDLIDYGDKNTDIAMAYGVVLIHKLDIFDYITEDLDDDYMEEGDVLGSMVYHTTDHSGNVVVKSYNEDPYSNGETDSEIERFDPRKHLEGDEREKYINFMANKKQKALEIRRQQEESYQQEEVLVDPLVAAARRFKKQNGE